MCSLARAQQLELWRGQVRMMPAGKHSGLLACLSVAQLSAVGQELCPGGDVGDRGSGDRLSWRGPYINEAAWAPDDNPCKDGAGQCSLRPGMHGVSPPSLDNFTYFVIIVIVDRKEETNGQHLGGNQLHRFGGVGDSRSRRHHPEQETMT